MKLEINRLQVDDNEWKNNTKRIGRDCPGNRVSCGSDWVQFQK